MKKSSIIGVLILCFAFWGKAQVRNEIRVPDPEGYRTLKCDFHIHTVFSDGLVWPTVRVDEAYREGLDAIALTEHLEYRPHRQDIIASHNRSYEIAEKTARNNQVILIRGSEITRPMAPGHFNAIFLSDCDALEQKEYMDSFKAARRQNAFIFWNHPGWDRQQPDIAGVNLALVIGLTILEGDISREMLESVIEQSKDAIRIVNLEESETTQEDDLF